MKFYIISTIIGNKTQLILFISFNVSSCNIWKLLALLCFQQWIASLFQPRHCNFHPYHVYQDRYVLHYLKAYIIHFFAVTLSLDILFNTTSSEKNFTYGLLNISGSLFKNSSLQISSSLFIKVSILLYGSIYWCHNKMSGFHNNTAQLHFPVLLFYFE